MIESNSDTCVNCGHSVASAYCPQCGQPQPPRKINFVNMYYDFQSRIYGFDGMFPRTFRDLTLRPGIVAREFIKGNRIRYYGPVGYFFLMITVFLLILSFTSISFYDYMRSMTVSDIKPNSGAEKFMQKFSELLAENMRLFSFLTIPINALTSKIFFRKSGLNFLEHTVLVFYAFGHIYWITILSLGVLVIFDVNPLSFAPTVLRLLLFGIGCMQLFNYQTKLKAFIKGILSGLLADLLFILVIVLILGIFLYLNPDYLELIRPSNNR